MKFIHFFLYYFTVHFHREVEKEIQTLSRVTIYFYQMFHFLTRRKVNSDVIMHFSKRGQCFYFLFKSTPIHNSSCFRKVSVLTDSEALALICFDSSLLCSDHTSSFIQHFHCFYPRLQLMRDCIIYSPLCKRFILTMKPQMIINWYSSLVAAAQMLV